RPRSRGAPPPVRGSPANVGRARPQRVPGCRESHGGTERPCDGLDAVGAAAARAVEFRGAFRRRTATPVTSSFAAFFWRRLLAAIVFVAVVSSSTIVLTHLAPGDATTELFLSGADAQSVAQERARLGLDLPLYAQVG